MKVSLPVLLLCTLVLSCGKKTHGTDYSPAPENTFDKLTSAPFKRKASLIPKGQVIRHSLSIEGLVKHGLTELLKSEKIDETSNFIQLEFTKGQLCRGVNGLNSGVWCSFETTQERCSLILVNNEFFGKRAIENVLSYAKLEQNLYETSFLPSPLQIGSATFYNFTPADEKQPSILYMRCNSTAHEEFSLNDINKNLGQELLTVPRL